MKKNKNLLNAKIIKTKKFQDHRGKFNKYFSMAMYPFFKKKKISIEEINYCFTKKRGTIRGMHFQKGIYEEDKIITCLKGKIFDVVVDLRKESKNFLKYKSFILDSKKLIDLYLYPVDLLMVIKVYSIIQKFYILFPINTCQNLKGELILFANN